MILLDVRFLSNFEEIIGTISEKVLHGLNLFFGSASFFLEVIRKILFNKIRKHEKQKTSVVMNVNNIINLVSRALSDNEISASEFDKITSQMTKWGETYRKFENVEYDNLEIDKLMPKMLPGRKSESFV